MMKFEYPIPVSGEDATELLGHKNAVGHYPMGRLFNWHGGLHVFEREYAPIKAIADGVVIAYRVGKTAIECEGVKFSNSFVLIKHKYVSPQGRELPFYSLYNHLMTFDELTAQNKVPDIFGVQKFEVSGQTIKGLFMRKASNFDEKVLVPKGMTVTIDFDINAQSAGATQWAADKKKEQYKKVKYVDPFTKTEYEDYFIFYTSDRFTNVTGSHYEVYTSEDSTLKKGENIRALNGSSIKYVVPNGTAVVVDGFVGDKKDYYRVKSLDGEKCDEELRVWAKSLAGAKEKALCFEEGDCGDVVTGEDCDIEVSAGDVVGFVGLNGFANNESHRSVHVEVFTNEASLSSFLKGVEGEKDDVKDTLNYTKIARGAKLSLKYPLTILKDDEIKVEEFPEGEDEKYCRISLAKVVREVTYYSKSNPSSANSYLSYKSGTQVTGADGEIVSAQYTPAKLKELNMLFYNTLQKDSILDWVASPAADRRQVSFCPSAGSLTLWTTKAALGISSKPSAPIKLTADLQELYYKRPENDELEFEVEQDVFKKTADLEKIGSEVDQNCWYKVKAVRSNIDDNGKRTYSPVEGYIKSDDSNVSSVSAYDWEAFGFEMLDSQADAFVFNNSTEGIEESKASEFLKAVWKHIDLNGDGELSRPELAKALKDSVAQQRLSRLVCYHQSEWGVDYEALKSEVEVLLDEGINKEKDEEKKQKLTEKKDKTLASLETKVKSFNFWDKVKEPGAAVAPAAPPPPPPGQTSLSARIANMDSPILTNLYPAMQQVISTSESTAITYEPAYVPMPKHPRFWHFHPMAFVEQMRRYSRVLDDKEKMRIMMIISEFEGKFYSCNKDSEFSMSTDQLSYAGVVHIGLSWGFVQFTQDGGSLGVVLKKMHEKNPSKFKEVFGDNFQELIDVTNATGIAGQDQYLDLSADKKTEYREDGTEVFGPRVKEVATEKGGNNKQHIWKSPWVERFVEAGKIMDFQEAQIEVAIDMYLNPSLQICKEYGLSSERSIAIAFDRTVNQGLGGARRLYRKLVDVGSKKTVDEELEISIKIRDNWSEGHFINTRLTKIIESKNLSDEQYEF